MALHIRLIEGLYQGLRDPETGGELWNALAAEAVSHGVPFLEFNELYGAIKNPNPIEGEIAFRDICQNNEQINKFIEDKFATEFRKLEGEEVYAEDGVQTPPMLDELMQQKSDLEARLAQVTALAQNHRKVMESNFGTQDDLQAQVQQMSEENGKLRQQLARREEEVKRISTEAEAQQTAEWTRIQGELETLHAKFATANRNNTDLRQTLQNTESRYEEQLLRLDAELSKSRSELASMAKPVPDRSAVEVQELRAKNDAMAKQFQEMVVANQQTVRGLEAELGQAQTQAIEARKQVDDLQEQLGADASVAGVSLVGLGDESLRLQVEELQRDKAAALRNFADSKNKLEEATAMLTKSEQQIGALRAQIDSAPNLEKLNGQIQDLTQSLQAAILSKATAERRATLGDDTIRKLQEDKANSVAGLQADVRAATDKAGALGRQLSEVTANSAGQIAILQQKLEQASARAASAETSLASTSASLASAQEANLRLNMQGGGKSAGADSALMRENAALKAELAQEKYNNSKTQVVNALIQSMRRDHHIAISPHKHTILVDKFAQALDDQYEDPASRAKFAAESAGKGAENLARGMLSKMKEEGVFRDSKSVGEDGVYNVAMFTLRRAYNLLSGDQYMSLNTGKLNEALSAAVQEARKAISPSNSSGSLHTIGSLSSASTESLIRGQGGRE